MGIEVFLGAAVAAFVIAVVVLRLMAQRRLLENKGTQSEVKFKTEIPLKAGKKIPKLKGDGKFAYKTRGCIPYAKNFDAVRISRRIYFVDPTVVEVLLVPDSANIERKLAVAVTLESKILGYVPSQEAGEIYKYLQSHPSGILAMAKIYLGSRAEYNGLMLDFAKPLRLEPKGRS
jgi:hypothetical protein